MQVFIEPTISCKPEDISNVVQTYWWGFGIAYILSIPFAVMNYKQYARWDRARERQRKKKRKKR